MCITIILAHFLLWRRVGILKDVRREPGIVGGPGFEDSFKAKCWTDSNELEVDFDVGSHNDCCIFKDRSYQCFKFV